MSRKISLTDIHGADVTDKSVGADRKRRVEVRNNTVRCVVLGQYTCELHKLSCVSLTGILKLAFNMSNLCGWIAHDRAYHTSVIQ